jgi:uncharacterized protein (TIGR02466 family)
METLELHEIFSVPLFKQTLNLNNEEIESYCLSLKEKNLGRSISNCGGWQSEGSTSIPFELQTLFDCVQASAETASQHMEMGSAVFGNWWVNINEYKDFNWFHVHPLSVLSGVYYVRAQENTGSINFVNPGPADWAWPSPVGYNKFNSSIWSMSPSTGVFYLFPSWLKHGVYPNMSKNETRISIAFNFN